MFKRIDPMVQLLVAAILLASVLPVSGPAREAAQWLSNAAVFMLFLLYGLKLSRREVLAGLGNHRLLVPLVVWVFGIMAAAGWGLWLVGQSLLPPLLALGFLYLGTLPSTVQAAVSYSSLAGGNSASSVVAAALVNILGVFITAPLFALLAGSQGAAVHSDTLFKVFSMLLLPFIIGQAAQRWAGGWVRGHKKTVTFLDRAAIGIAVYVAFSGAIVQGLWGKVDASSWGFVLMGCAILLGVGYAGSWLLGGLLGLPRGDRISLLFAGAQKSAAMGAPLATVLFPPAVAGIIIVPLLTYHLSQMVVAAPIAARLRAGADAVAD
jgi:sodium/bile acid cotransporter 7